MRKLKTLLALLVLSFFTIGNVWATDVTYEWSMPFSSSTTNADIADDDESGATMGAYTSKGALNAGSWTNITNGSYFNVSSNGYILLKLPLSSTTVSFRLQANVFAWKSNKYAEKAVSVSYYTSKKNTATDICSGSTTTSGCYEIDQNVTLGNGYAEDDGTLYIKIAPAAGNDGFELLAVTTTTSTGGSVPTVSLTPYSLTNLEAEGVGDTTITISCSNFASAITSITAALFDDEDCENTFSGDWIEKSAVSYSTDTTITLTIDDNDGAAREAWLRVIAQNSTEADTAILPVSQKLYVAPLTTMDAILAAAKANGSTAKEARVKFNNWVVTGVSTNYAYVSDGTKGFGIYIASHGYEVGDILSGTVTVSLKLNNGSAQITGVTSGTIGVTKDGTPVLNVLDDAGVAALDSVNTGSLIKIRGNCTRTGTSGSYKYYVGDVQVYGSLYGSAVTQLTLNTINDVTGVYLQYNTTKEILPRSSADIKAVPVVTTNVSSLSFEAKQNNAVAGKKFTLTGANLTADDLTISASTGFGVDIENITPTAGAVAATQITVTPATPKTATTPVEGTVTISGGGLEEDVVINLSMAVTPTFAVSVAVAVNPAAEGKATATINGGAIAYVADGDEFSLEAAALNPSKYAFVGWTVAAADEEHISFTDAASASTTATADAALTITANFDSITTPSLAVSVEEIDFNHVDFKSNPDAESFNITGAHLKNVVGLALNGDLDENFEFEVTGSLTPDAQENVSATVSVKPITTAVGTFIGQLVVSSEDVGNDTIDLSVVVDKLSANLSWSTDAATVTIDANDNIFPTLVNPRKLPVVYSSLYDTIATINASTGAIELVGPGETFIIVNFAGNDTVKAIATDELYYTLTVQKRFTVSFSTGAGNDDVDPIQETTVGAGITLPAATPDCEDWTFAGWATAAVGESTATAPTLLLENSNYKPTDDCTLYAVYKKTVNVTPNPTAYTAGDEGDFVLAAYNTTEEKWYALPTSPTLSSGKIAGEVISVDTTANDIIYVTINNANGYKWTIADATNGQTIGDGTKTGDKPNYIYHSTGGNSGTNLAYGTSTTFTWKIESEENGLTFQGMNDGTVKTRGMLLNGTNFGGYSLSNEDASGYYRIQVLPISGGSVLHYISAPTCGETSIENTTIESENAIKVLKDGQIYILRGEKVYTIQGQLVK